MSAPWGVVAAIGAGVGLTVATHVTAWSVGFNPASLGKPATWLSGIPLYYPWMALEWWRAWGSDVSQLQDGAYLGMASTVGTVLYGLRDRLKKPETPEREKTWGTKAEAEKAGILPRKKAGILPRKLTGAVLGMWGRSLIGTAQSDQSHILVVAGTGMGKSSGISIPTALNCQNSMLIVDPKRTMYPTTARYRASLGEAAYFDPTDIWSLRFNPLFEITKETEIGQAQVIAEILVMASGEPDDGAFWKIKASQLLAAIILHLINDLPRSDQHLGHILPMFEETKAAYEAMTKSNHPEARRCGKIMLEHVNRTTSNIAGSIWATVEAALMPFIEPLVIEKTRTSDFRISDLVCSPYPMTLYLQMRNSEAGRLRPLQLIIMRMIRKAMLYDVRKMQDGRKKLHRLTMLVDEFAELGKDADFEADISQFREYGISVVLLCTSLKSLEVYGPNQNITPNIQIMVAMATGDHKEAHTISDLAGKFDERKVSDSKGRGIKDMFSLGHRSTTTQLRPLLDEGDVRGLSRDELLIFVTGARGVFRCNRLQWFDHPLFKNRGTNIEKGEPEPDQNPIILERLKSKPSMTLKDVVGAMGWKHEDAAQALFPAVNVRTAKAWISRDKVPAEQMPFIEHLCKSAAGVSDIKAFLTNETIEQLRNGEVV